MRSLLILGLVVLLGADLLLVGVIVTGGRPLHTISYLVRKWTDIFQAGSAVAVACFTYVLVQTSRKQLDVIANQAEHMKGQLKAATIQAQSARESVALAELAFQRTERPYVYILNVSAIQYDFHELTGDYVPFFTYTVANYGKTPATIEGLWLDVEEGAQHSNVFLEAYSDHPLYVAGFVGAGERIAGLRYIFPSNMKWEEHYHPDPGSDREHPEYVSPISTEDLFFFVRISYSGPYSENHSTSANWRYDSRINRFVRIGGAQYDHMK